MGVDVPRRVWSTIPMAMSDAERAELGDRIRKQRERKFGTKKAAYQEAGVNAGTWDKAEAGESIRGDRLRNIVRILWPESEGDWTAIDEVQRERQLNHEQRIAELERLYRRLAARDSDDSIPEGENLTDPGVSA